MTNEDLQLIVDSGKALVLNRIKVSHRAFRRTIGKRQDNPYTLVTESSNGPDHQVYCKSIVVLRSWMESVAPLDQWEVENA